MEREVIFPPCDGPHVYGLYIQTVMEEGRWTTGESWGQNNQPNLKPMGRNRQWTIWTLESIGRTDGYMGVGGWVGGREGQGYYILYKSVV